VRGILTDVRDLGSGITAYGVLTRGLRACKTAVQMGPGDFRSRLPRWSGENQQRNLAAVARLNEIARSRGATTWQLAMAWVLSRGKEIIPLAGARTRAQLSDALSALELRLSAGELSEIGAAVPPEAVAGERYDPHAMAMLDSER